MLVLPYRGGDSSWNLSKYDVVLRRTRGKDTKKKAQKQERKVFFAPTTRKVAVRIGVMHGAEQERAIYFAGLRNCCNFAKRNRKNDTIMARPIKEIPVLTGEDALNFEIRRLMVENRTPEERAEAHRKFQERVAEADKHIEWCW